MNTGNFGGFGAIYDRTTQPTSSGTYVRTPFPSNQIPSAGLTHLCRAAAFYPLPNGGQAQFAAKQFRIRQGNCLISPIKVTPG
jgi:hypothetical protein